MLQRPGTHPLKTYPLVAVALSALLAFTIPRPALGQADSESTPDVCPADRANDSSDSVQACFTTVLDQADLVRWSPRTLPELLNQLVPGGYALDRGADQLLFGSIRIRGPAGFPPCPTCRPKPSILVLIDGVEVSAAALTALSIHHIRRVEVIPGARAAYLYGPDAERGVIRLYTLDGPTQPGREIVSSIAGSLRSTPYLEARPFGSQIAAGLGALSGSTRFGVGFQREVDDGHVPNLSTTAHHGSFAIRTMVDEIELKGFARLSDTAIDYPDRSGVLYQLFLDGLVGDPSGRIRENRAQYRRLTAGAGLGYRLSPTWKLEVGAGEDIVDVEYLALASPASGDSLVQDEGDRHLLPSGYLRLQGAVPVGARGELLLHTGVNAHSSDHNRRTSVYVDRDESEVTHWRGSLTNEEFSGWGGFGIAGFRIGPAALLGGVRMDRDTRFGPDAARWWASPHADASFTTALGGWTAEARAGWSSALGAPTGAMLTGLAPEIQPNPAIEPQRTRGFDLGINLRHSDSGLRLTGFSQRTQGALGPREDGRYTNFPGTLRNRGGEIDVRWSANATHLRAFASYIYTEVEHPSPTYPVEPMPGDPYPEWRLMIEMDQSLEPLLGVDVTTGARVRTLGRRWATDLRAIQTAAHGGPPVQATHRWFDPVTRLDLRLDAPVWRGLEIEVELLNAADQLAPEVPEYVVSGSELRLTLSGALRD